MDSQCPISKHTFFLLPKNIKKNKINYLGEEDNVLTSMGGVPSLQNGVWRQPHPLRDALDREESEDPSDALLFLCSQDL